MAESDGLELVNIEAGTMVEDALTSLTAVEDGGSIKQHHATAGEADGIFIDRKNKNTGSKYTSIDGEQIMISRTIPKVVALITLIVIVLVVLVYVFVAKGNNKLPFQAGNNSTKIPAPSEEINGTAYSSPSLPSNATNISSPVGTKTATSPMTFPTEHSLPTNDTLPPVECNENNECPKGVCALENYLTVHTVCCESGEAVMLGDRLKVCKGGTREGEDCGWYDERSDVICFSGICMDGACKATKLGAGESCDYNRHCESGACAESSLLSPKVCCVSGESVMIYSSEVCTGETKDGYDCGWNNEQSDLVCSSGLCIQGNCKPTNLVNGTKCDDSRQCNSGACARSNYPENSWSSGAGEMVCCERNETVTVAGAYENKEVCKGLDIGKRCGNEGNVSDSICDSNICIQGICSSASHGPNEACDSDHPCPNGACARKDYSSDQTVCCESGEAVKVGWSEDEVCTNVPAGGRCGYDGESSDSVCSSGLCYEGTCRDDKLQKNEACNKDSACLSGVCFKGTCRDKLGSNEQCDQNNHCQNRTCARRDYEAWSYDTICCESGESISFEYGNVCTGLPDGADCGTKGNLSNAICSSGTCINGKCASGKLNSTETCNDNDDCQGGVCAGAGYFEVYTKICCPTNASVNVEYGDVCTGLPEGTDCGYALFDEATPSVCASGRCIDGKCAAVCTSSRFWFARKLCCRIGWPILCNTLVYGGMIVAILVALGCILDREDQREDVAHLQQQGNFNPQEDHINPQDAEEHVNPQDA